MPEREPPRKEKKKIGKKITNLAVAAAALGGIGYGANELVDYFQSPTVSENGWSVQVAPKGQYKELPRDKSLSSDDDEDERFVAIKSTKQEKLNKNTNYDPKGKADLTGIILSEEDWSKGQKGVDYHNHEKALRVSVWGKKLGGIFDSKDELTLKENKNVHPILEFKSKAGDDIFVKVTRETVKGEDGVETKFNLTRVQPVQNNG
jgi:hypothetical protein